MLRPYCRWCQRSCSVCCEQVPRDRDVDVAGATTVVQCRRGGAANRKRVVGSPLGQEPTPFCRHGREAALVLPLFVACVEVSGDDGRAADVGRQPLQHLEKLGTGGVGADVGSDKCKASRCLRHQDVDVVRAQVYTVLQVMAG